MRHGRGFDTRVVFIATIIAGCTGALLLAGRFEPREPREGVDPVEDAQQRAEASRFPSIQPPESTPPPPEFAVFGGRRPARIGPGEADRTLLPTNLGRASWDPDADILLAGLSADLRLPPGELKRSPRGTAHRGLNFVALDPGFVAGSGADAALRALERHGRVIASLPDAVFQVWVEAPDRNGLLDDPAVAHVRPVVPAHRISPDVGALPRLSRHEAARPELLVRVTMVPGHDSPALQHRLEALAGVSEVTPDLFGGGYQLRVDYRQVAKLAAIDEVAWIEPVYDYLLANAEGVPMVQMGSAEDGQFARPFDDAGVDGGGIDTNSDGRRINNGSDTVPPQIVAVVDNGVSVDTASFAQTLTQTSIAVIAPIGGTHRKVHAIQNAGDSGTTCDAPLSGGSTHGHVVASILSADASSLGIRASRPALDGASAPRSLSLDGVARGSRILMEDAANVTLCSVNSLIERGGNVNPGSLLDRLNAAICPIVQPPTGPCSLMIGGGDDLHVAVLPFGAPNNFGPIFSIVNGTYPQEAADIDKFLYNNRDTLVFVPVGNNGGTVTTNRLGLLSPVIPDLFDGRVDNDNPNIPSPIQITSPSTAKNIVSVGSSQYDCFTFFGVSDCETRPNGFTSRGPATPESLRMAPMLTAPSFDMILTPFTGGVAVFSSRDNDNLAPIESQLDEAHFGTSYSSAFVGGQALLVRDYFQQGFYPTGSRGPATDRMPRISGALVKAALAASADFGEGTGTAGTNGNDLVVRKSRAVPVPVPGGTETIGNSEQGYGSSVLTDVLPLQNWPDTFVLHPDSGQPREYPAAALLVWDSLSTGEPLINNGGHTSATHLFRLASPEVVTTTGGGLAAAHAQLRIAVAWPDRPSAAGSGGPLINDLDLLLESPGPDNCLAPSDTKPDGSACPGNAATDNLFYDGNRYGGLANAPLDQWSVPHASGAEVHDKRNPVEAIHLSADPNNDRSDVDSPLYLGRWRVTVKRGLGGAVPGSLVINAVPTDPDGNEDDNNNGRLDAGEDDNANGLLDLPGQDFGLVVSGPVFLDEIPPAIGPASFPGSRITFDRMRYTCAESAGLGLFDATPGASAGRAAASTSVWVLNASGLVTDTESGLTFTTPTPSVPAFASSLPVRLAAPPVPGNGILEADSGSTLLANYAPAGQRAVTARAPVDCRADLINGVFLADNGAQQGQVTIRGGCDDDDFPDAGEVVSYGVAIRNRSRSGGYTHVTATLTPSGPGGAALRVLDSPKDLGALPTGATIAAFFDVFVDPVALDALPVASRTATFTLSLDSSERGAPLERQSYTFTHALNSDRQELFYSTDRPTGGREIRDLDRDLGIQRAGGYDASIDVTIPREDVTFATLFAGTQGPPGHFTNELGEDLDLGGTFTGSERDILPNATVDRGILNSNNPADAAHRVPWDFERNGGGWVPFRHPASIPAGIPSLPVWERPTGWVCGFQTATMDADPGTAGDQPRWGIWHTGDGNLSTPSAVATVCDNYARPQDGASPGRTENLFDILESPIVAKVNQTADSRGFPYSVEFQRFAFNLNIQTFDGYVGGGINIDNDVDDDGTNSFLVQHLDQYYERKFGGWPAGLFRFTFSYLTGPVGVSPASTSPPQRTFGPFINPNNSPTLDGDESGFPGLTGNTNPNSTSPIPTAPPDLLPAPLPGGPRTGICDGGANDGGLCQTATAAVDCPGGVCSMADDNNAGPVRNFETSLVGYEGGVARTLLPGIENTMIFLPGAGGTRWQIGIGFWAIEGSSSQTDYGIGIDDPVFEWLEWHPEDEAGLGRPPACSRFGGAGQPAGGQCATLLADRTQIFDCAGPLVLTVFDAKCRVVGAGATSTLGGACTTDGQCGTGGVCSAALPSVSVLVTTSSDAGKSVTLLPVAGSPGLYRGSIGVSTTVADATHLFSDPGADLTYTAYYRDPLCDGDRDGQAAEDDFANLDGDGVPSATDTCPDIYDPAQTDTDADGFGDLCDNCPTIADPTQADSNHDGVGNLCEYDDVDGDTIANLSDNCPDVRNPNQSDIDFDGRGDLCDTLKTSGVTFGGVPTAATGAATECKAGACVAPAIASGDGCAHDEACIRSCDTSGGSPGVCSNTGGYIAPQPAVGAACTTHADCYRDIDRDADGVDDAADNCVLAQNGPLGGPSNQTDSDGDGLGDACDPDCAGVIHISLCRGSSAACTPPDTSVAACTPNNHGLGSICQHYVANAGACSAANDDVDADGVPDLADDCPAVPNPAVVAGSTRQADRDRDGRGDACDAADALDDEGDAQPDDVVTFTGTIACRQQPLASLQLLDVAYRDLDGDLDTFPDTGETGRLVVTVRNPGARLTDVRLILISSDPDVGCVTGTTLNVASIEAGATVVLGSLDAGPPGWTFTASNALQALPPPAPLPAIDMRFDVLSAESSGTLAPLTFSLRADVDAYPGVAQVFVPGPDGLDGTADDGTVKESFDADRDGDGNYTVRDTFKRPISPGVNRGTCSNAPRTYCATDADCPAANPAPTCQTGSYLRGSATGVEAGRVAAITCGGFDTAANNSLCILDPDYPMDWHLHCPHGATNCPNVESGVCNNTGIGACSFATPTDGTHSLSVPNSLHMGAHYMPGSIAGDTTHLRTLQGFMSPAMNLALVPRTGDLDLSFFQIARLMDNNGVSSADSDANENQCVDCGDVQIQVDLNPDPDLDEWGTWDKLVPYQNVYDHKPNAWSTFGSYYCLFTPTDTGTAPPNPRGVHETICYPLGAWSHCGSNIGTVATTTLNCPGPGVVEPSGVGVWVQTRFDLHGYVGQRVRVRWMAETWNFGPGFDSYLDGGYDVWSFTTQEDGWWLDDIVLTGVVNDQVAPVPDTKPRTGTCPSDPCDATQGDAGTAVVLSVTDPGGTPITGAVVAGQPIQVRASGSTFPGGCVGGIPEFEFRRDGVVVQPFGTPATFADAPEATASYSVKMRCTTDPGCTSVAGGTVQVAVQSGEGGDAAFGTWASPFNPANGLLYDRALATTTLNWGGPGPNVFDVYRGSIGGTSRGHLVNGAWLLDVGPSPGAPPTCLLNGISGTPAPSGILGGVNGTSGALNQAADPNPPLGGVNYYLVVRAGPKGGAVNAFGCANPAVCQNTGWCEAGSDPGRPCTVNGDCPGGGACTTESMPCRTDTGAAHLGGCARHTVCAAGSNPGHLCESNADCLGGGTCPALAAGVSTAGAVCMNVTLDPPAGGLGVPVNGCPGRTSVRRIIRTVPAGGLCP